MNEILYKFTSWWQNLGLILIGYLFIQNFNFITLGIYMVLGAVLLIYAHVLDDFKFKMIRIIEYVIFGILLILREINFLSIFQSLLIFIIVVFLCPLYTLWAKRHPISAFYKGFAYPALFWLPFANFSLEALPLYFLVSVLATISEIFHDAHHFEQDKKEGRFTTAHLLNFKTTGNVRRRVRLVIFSIGVILLIYLILI